MHFIRQPILLLSLILLASCSVGPNYVGPPVDVPAAYKEAKHKRMTGGAKIHWKKAQPKDMEALGNWWEIFQDKRLNSLEAQLNDANQTIQNAFHNYQQARALIDEARASYFPTLSGSLSLTRQRNSGSTSFISSSNGQTSTGTATTGTGAGGSAIVNSHTWLLDASWEPDLWGLVRRTVEASVAGAEASAALYASTRLSMQATMAQVYFELRGLDAMQKLLDDTVKGYKKSLLLTKHRYAAGVAARADVVSAQSVLEAAQALAVNNGILRSQYEHAIAVLVGVPPANFSLKFSPLYANVPAIPIALPSELLERRPDIAQAERLMAQANAQIGVAVAAYFPSLTLTGTASTGAKNLGPLWAVPSLSWSLGTQLAETILDGGLRSATVLAAKENYYALVASYRQVVLTAFQDVEDNLAALRILNQQAVIERRAVKSAKWSVLLTTNQYKAGTVDYSSVITSQVNAFSVQQNAVTVKYQQMVAAVGLIKALGGPIRE